MGLGDTFKTIADPAGFSDSKGGDQGFKPHEIEQIINAQAKANRVNQITPYGSLQYNGSTATTTLSPEQQALLEQQQVSQLLSGQLGAERLGGLGGSGDATEAAVFDRAMSLMNPQFARHEEQLRQRLANQGLPQSSGAFTSEVGRFEDTRNRAVQDAALQAVLAGSGEQTNELNRVMSLFGLAQPAQPQFINVPQVTVPVNQPGGGMNPMQGVLGGAASGAATGTAIMPGWGTAVGAGIGGLMGYGATR